MGHFGGGVFVGVEKLEWVILGWGVCRSGVGHFGVGCL